MSRDLYLCHADMYLSALISYLLYLDDVAIAGSRNILSRALNIFQANSDLTSLTQLVLTSNWEC